MSLFDLALLGSVLALGTARNANRLLVKLLAFLLCRNCPLFVHFLGAKPFFVHYQASILMVYFGGHGGVIGYIPKMW